MNAITAAHHFITLSAVVARFLMVGNIVEQECAGAFGPWLTQITGPAIVRESDGAWLFPATNQFGGLETFEVKAGALDGFVGTWDVVA
jgi:hypothetical protein